MTDLNKNNIIECPQAAYTPYTRDKLLKVTYDLKTDIGDILKQIQKEYNESLDIDDDDEYIRIQSEIRERRKKFRAYSDFFISCYEVIDKFAYSELTDTNAVADVQENELSDSVIVSDNTTKTSDISKNEAVKESSVFTEQEFLTWLMTDSKVSELTARQYISDIHSIEKLYQTLFGDRKNCLALLRLKMLK